MPAEWSEDRLNDTGRRSPSLSPFGGALGVVGESSWSESSGRTLVGEYAALSPRRVGPRCGAAAVAHPTVYGTRDTDGGMLRSRLSAHVRPWWRRRQAHRPVWPTQRAGEIASRAPRRVATRGAACGRPARARRAWPCRALPSPRWRPWRDGDASTPRQAGCRVPMISNVTPSARRGGRTAPVASSQRSVEGTQRGACRRRNRDALEAAGSALTDVKRIAPGFATRTSVTSPAHTAVGSSALRTAPAR